MSTLPSGLVNLPSAGESFVHQPSLLLVVSIPVQEESETAVRSGATGEGSWLLSLDAGQSLGFPVALGCGPL